MLSRMEGFKGSRVRAFKSTVGLGMCLIICGVWTIPKGFPILTATMWVLVVGYENHEYIAFAAIGLQKSEPNHDNNRQR